MRRLLLALALLAATSAAAEPVLFARDVWPLFVRSCVACHSTKARYANLQLDSPARILQGGDSARAVVPGKPEASEIVRRLSLAEHDLDFMPRERQPFTPGELALVKRWIAEGASFGSWVGMTPAPKPGGGK
jgi:hypothetical protein